MQHQIIKLYEYDQPTAKFTLLGLIDDYEELSYSYGAYNSGTFAFTINKNFPNSDLPHTNFYVIIDNFQGVILNITDEIGNGGKATQKRKVTGFDLRHIFQQRVISNFNSDGKFEWTGKGEEVLRKLISYQCGTLSSLDRQFPLDESYDTAHGEEITISVGFNNLLQQLETIATQTKLTWQVKINLEDNLFYIECEDPIDKSSEVKINANSDTLLSGSVQNNFENYTNTVYIIGKGEGDEQDVYEGKTSYTENDILILEEGNALNVNGANLLLSSGVATGVNRYESYQSKTELTKLDDYIKESKAILNEYNETYVLNGDLTFNALGQYGDKLKVGNIIALRIYDVERSVMIQNVSYSWRKGNLSVSIEVGKPLQDLQKQLGVLIARVQKGTKKNNKISSVCWYDTPDDDEQKEGETEYDTLGFIGSGGDFNLYFDRESQVGSKTYHIYVKETTGTVTLKTESGGSLALTSGTYVTIIYVDSEGNIIKNI